jgi:hypothetical protein
MACLLMANGWQAPCRQQQAEQRSSVQQRVMLTLSVAYRFCSISSNAYLPCAHACVTEVQILRGCGMQ